MTWTKLGDSDLDGPDFLTLPRGVRLMHVEALIWCNRHQTDGAIPRHALRRLTDEDDPDAAAVLLVGVGQWTETEVGWRIVDFLNNQVSAEDAERAAELNRARQRRSRQHKLGDHSLCDPRYCNASRVTNGVTGRVSNAVSNGSPSRPVPTRPVRGGEREGTGDDGAPSGSRRTPTPPKGDLLNFDPAVLRGHR